MVDLVFGNLNFDKMCDVHDVPNVMKKEKYFVLTGNWTLALRLSGL
jgi:hypothetical protein